MGQQSSWKHIISCSEHRNDERRNLIRNPGFKYDVVGLLLARDTAVKKETLVSSGLSSSDAKAQNAGPAFKLSAFGWRL